MMIKATDTKVIQVQPDDSATLPAQLTEEAWRAFLMELRRALITQLRSVESALGMEHSIPARKRPH